MKTYQLFQVDAFTNQPFKGNPAGVCISDVFPEKEVMQNIAMELNCSETAFVASNGSTFDIRYFTPIAEVPLCGHATLSEEHIMYETERLPLCDKIVFNSSVGELSVRKQGHFIELNFPVYPLEEIEITDEFEKAVGQKVLKLIETDDFWNMAVLKNEQAVKDCAPQLHLLKKWGKELIITARSDHEKYDFVCRCFAPSSGIDEDPVTGSAHCALTPYWSKVLGKKEMRSHQISKRSGKIWVTKFHDKIFTKGETKKKEITKNIKTIERNLGYKN